MKRYLFLVLALGFLSACNNEAATANDKADSIEERKDTLLNNVDSTKDGKIDSIENRADQLKDKIDSSADARKDSIKK